MEEEAPVNTEFSFQTVGEQLKAERERRGWGLEDVATRTRIPIRHLESLETSSFSKIPGTTYAMGFARSYARAMEMNEVKLGTELRAELAESGQSAFATPLQNYEPADPSSVPSRMLAWTAAGIGALVVAGYFVFRSFSLGDAAAPAETPVVAEKPAAETAAPANPAAVATPATGEVVMTATGVVWVKVYDAEKKRLFESEMKAGDKYTVPSDANGPMLVTGRPDLLNFTIAGQPYGALGTGERTVSDVGISAKALSQRPPVAAPATTDAATAVVPAATPAPSASPQ